MCWREMRTNLSMAYKHTQTKDFPRSNVHIDLLVCFSNKLKQSGAVDMSLIREKLQPSISLVHWTGRVFVSHMYESIEGDWKHWNCWHLKRYSPLPTYLLQGQMAGCASHSTRGTSPPFLTANSILKETLLSGRCSRIWMIHESLCPRGCWAQGGGAPRCPASRHCC